MSLHWRPVGPEPASTYWRRRAAVAAVALLPLVLLIGLLGGDDGGNDERDVVAGPAAPASASPAPAEPVPSSPSPLPSPVVTPCTESALKIEAEAAEQRYRVGTSPRLTLTVTNTGSAPCAVDLGQAAVELRVFSGRDRIWSSDDCKPGGGTAVTTLQPGKSEVQRVTWDGRRSVPGCDGGKAQAQAGTYRLTARVGAVEANGGSFVFTG